MKAYGFPANFMLQAAARHVNSPSWPDREPLHGFITVQRDHSAIFHLDACPLSYSIKSHSSPDRYKRSHMVLKVMYRISSTAFSSK